MQKLTKSIFSAFLCLMLLTQLFPCALPLAHAVAAGGSAAATEISLPLEVLTNPSGITSGTVDESEAQAAINTAKAAEQSGSSAIIVIDTTASGTVKNLRLKIPQSVLAEIAIDTGASLRLESTLGSLAFDSKALVAIYSASKGLDVTIGIAKTDKAASSLGLDFEPGDRPVYEYYLGAGQKQIYNLVGGSVSASIPYAPKSTEDKNALLIYSLDESGNSKVASGGYFEAQKAFVFPLTSFSTYAVGYKKVYFEDVDAASWYSDAVTYLAARKITGGVDGTHFGPENQLTRGQFVVLLLKAYGISPLSASADNFSDAGNTYYTGYLAAAKKLQITSGTGGGAFSPESPITRQDMFTILYRTLKILGRVPPKVSSTTLNSFGDGGNVSGYATEAMNALIGAGIIMGSGGYLSPYSGCTRAEMAQVLYRLLSA